MPERDLDSVTPSENPGRGIEDTSEPEPTSESQVDDVTPSPDPGRGIGGSSGGGSSRRSSGSSEPQTQTVTERATFDPRQGRLERIVSGTSEPATAGESGESGGITDRIRDIGQAGADRVRSATDTIEDTLPGRTGQAAAAGVGVAAVPEPTPATEVGGLGLAAGATLVGGGILATRAVRDSELEIGDATPSELDPTRSRQDVRELGVSGSPTVGTSELEPTGAGTVATELGIGDFTASDELDVTGGEGATGTAERPADETVVPDDFPLAGRDIPRDPTQEAGGEPSPEDIVGGADTATGVTVGTGTGETTGRDRTTGTTVGSGTGTASEILEEVRRDIEDPVQRDPGGAFRPEREFPTGAGAVVGREVGRVEESQDIGVGVGTGAGVGVGAGGPASDPFAGAVEGQRRELGPTDRIGIEPGGGRGGFGLDTRQRTGMFEETGTPTDTGTGTEFGPGTGTEFGPGTDTSTATDTAQATALQTDVMLDQRQAMQQELAQPTANEALFAHPTLTEPAFGGGTSGGQPPSRPPRPPFDLDELSSEPPEINLQTDEAVFGSGILDGDEAFERAFER